MNLQIQQEAADWFVEFRIGEPDAVARKAFDTWIRQSPEHLRAYLEMAEIWQDTPHVGSIGDSVDLIDEARGKDNVVLLRDARTTPSAMAVDGRWSQRNRFLAFAASIALLLVGGTATWLVTHPAEYSTGIGEQRTIRLTDGSTVELNSHTRFRVAFHRHERDVELLEGQALFHVAKDARRPFFVHSDGAQVRAVGTEFDVYRKSDQTIVTVVEGQVAVIPDSPGSAKTVAAAVDSAPTASRSDVLLAAGEQLTVSKRSAPKPIPVDTAAATSWTQHKVVFKSTPLPEVFAELNRYNTRPLRIIGSGLEGFQISGTYATTDSTLLVRFLRDQPGLTIRETDTEILVSKAP